MKTSKSVVCKCSRCNKPFKAYAADEHPLCKSCKAALNEEKLKNLTGETIHKTMTRTHKDAVFNSVHDLDVSMALFSAKQRIEEERRNASAMTLKCKRCGNEFSITVGEKEWYEEKGLCLPVRCPECRKWKKQY